MRFSTGIYNGNSICQLKFNSFRSIHPVPVRLRAHLAIVEFGHVEHLIALLVIPANNIQIAIQKGRVKTTPRQSHLANPLPIA